MGNVSQIYDGKWVLVVADKAKVQFLQLCFKAWDEWAKIVLIHFTMI